MTAKKKYKVRIDLEFTDVKEAVELIGSINTFSIKNYEFKKQLNTANLYLQRIFNTSLVESRFEIINGVRCFVYPSQMNEETENEIRKFIKE
jgi:hypothetical protein